ncbi:hypothetical protein AB5I41_07245 [Sphingomonas sp. MMS24-JH45]
MVEAVFGPSGVIPAGDAFGPEDQTGIDAAGARLRSSTFVSPRRTPGSGWGTMVMFAARRHGGGSNCTPAFAGEARRSG